MSFWEIRMVTRRRRLALFKFHHNWRQKLVVLTNQPVSSSQSTVEPLATKAVVTRALVHNYGGL